MNCLSFPGVDGGGGWFGFILRFAQINHVAGGIGNLACMLAGIAIVKASDGIHLQMWQAQPYPTFAQSLDKPVIIADFLQPPNAFYP